MNNGFLLSALALISVLTSLTVEAIKKILNEKQVEYSSNLLAVIVSTILTVALCVGYTLYFGEPFTIQKVIIMIALTFLSFLSATVSFDKVKQALQQIGKI
jgi:hypothetical protein